MTLEEILPLLVPIIILQLVLVAVGLFDLSRTERRVKGGTKVVWALVIIFGQMIGPLAYFLMGREED
jgi:DMSO reductase anchor subunit